MKFRYRARDDGGKLQEGTVEAPDQAAALQMLQQRGLTVIRLDRVRFAVDLNADIDLGALFGRRPVSAAELALFCDQFAALAGAGVPILQALSVLAAQFKGRRLALVIQGIVRAIEGGHSLSQAMDAYRAELPPVMIYITAVAEVAGRLEEAYLLLARQFEQEDQLSRRVKSAFMYPAVVLSVALMVVLFMLTYVLPTYARLFQQMGAALPPSTRVLMTVGTFIKTYYYLVPVALLLLWLLLRWLLRQPRVAAGVERLVLKIPLMGALRYKRELARLCRTLGTMGRSGVPLMAALATAQEATPWAPLRQALAAVQAEVAAGETFAGALRHQPLFDRISVEMLALGEQAGTLDTMLFRVADTAERDVQSLLQRLTSLLEPALTVLVGGLVVSIIVPMLLPMFEILGKVR
jgi:type IV pilus assembly protein PilC